MTMKFLAAAVLTISAIGSVSHAEEWKQGKRSGLVGGAVAGAVVAGPVGAVVGGVVGATAGSAIDKQKTGSVKKRVVIEENHGER